METSLHGSRTRLSIAQAYNLGTAAGEKWANEEATIQDFQHISRFNESSDYSRLIADVDAYSIHRALFPGTGYGEFVETYGLGDESDDNVKDFLIAFASAVGDVYWKVKEQL